MKKTYHLSSCDSCKRILKEWNLAEDHELQDLKKTALTPKQLDELYALSGSYEALINKRARLFKEKGIKTSELTEALSKELLLDHYTFLKRPVTIIDSQLFIGNGKNEVAAVKTALN